MWYAASEIVFFLILAAVIGGSFGYGVAQIYQLDFAGVRAARAERKENGDELAEARVEIADLRRKLDMVTEALRGDVTPPAELAPPLIAPSTAEEVQREDDGETIFPPVPSSGHAEIEVTANPEGRRLSDRVADAERG